MNRLDGSLLAIGEAKGLEDLHLFTYDTRSGTHKDNGAVFLEDAARPTCVNSIATARTARTTPSAA